MAGAYAELEVAMFRWRTTELARREEVSWKCKAPLGCEHI